MLSICCTEPRPDIKSLTRGERQRFGKLVNDLRKQGKDLQSAQVIAYSIVLAESIPYVRK